MTDEKKNKVDHSEKQAKALPPPQFSNLVMSIASAAVLKMGLDSKSKETKDLALARYNIDLLDLLKEKTKNNLSKEEQELLESCVSDLQLQLINVENNEKQEKKV